MTEHLEIERGGKTFCFCEICLQDECDLPSSFIENVISNVKKGISDYVDSFSATDDENEKINRWSIVPYRYRLSVLCRNICDRLIFIEFLSSFDARFPGGRHVKGGIAVIFDTKHLRCLKPSFVFFPDIPKKTKRKLGIPLYFAFDGNQIKLVCSLGEYALEAAEFCKSYKTFSDFGLNFDKKTIDKQENI